MAPSAHLISLRDVATAAAMGSSNDTTASDVQQTSTSSDSLTTWILVAIIVGIVVLIAISVFVILRMQRLRHRNRKHQSRNEMTAHQQHGQPGCLSPLAHRDQHGRPSGQHQRKLSKISDADRRSWGEHMEEEQRAMIIQKSLAGRSPISSSRRRSDSVSSTNESITAPPSQIAATTPTPALPEQLSAAPNRSYGGSNGFEDSEDEEQVGRASEGGLREDWKAFEAQLSLSGETHPAATRGGLAESRSLLSGAVPSPPTSHRPRDDGRKDDL